MKKLRARGIVTSGKGEGEKFVKLLWFKNQIIEKFGFTPYPGTLNIKLSKESLKVKGILEKGEAIEILPDTDFHAGICFQAYLMEELECAVIIPRIPNYPIDIIEVIAPVNLREELQLRDGDSVEITIRT